MHITDFQEKRTGYHEKYHESSGQENYVHC